jgi:hypothetical protein
VLILALLSQLVAAVVTSLVVIWALRGLLDRLLTQFPPAGALTARRWMTGVLIAIGITSGVRLGIGPGAELAAWPFLGAGRVGMDPSLAFLAASAGLAAALGALRGLAFAALFLLGVLVLGQRGESAAVGRRMDEPGRRIEARREPMRGREAPHSGRPMRERTDDPRDRSGEPRRMPGGGGGGRGRGPLPGRERDRSREGREGPEGREVRGGREGREGLRNPRGLPGSFGSPRERNPMPPRFGARPIPDPAPLVSAGTVDAGGRERVRSGDGRLGTEPGT